MARDDDKDLRRGPDPLRKFHEQSIGERVKDAGRQLFKQITGNPLSKTPADELKLTEKEPWLFESGMGKREKWVSDSDECRSERELVERAAIDRITTFGRAEWVPAKTEARVVALQALLNRLQEVQGRTELYRVEASSELKRRAETDHKGFTIKIHSDIIGQANPRDAIAALFVQMHLLMQREAVNNPAAFAEHGIKNIQKWAEPKAGDLSYSKKDALAYAKRLTDHLR